MVGLVKYSYLGILCILGFSATGADYTKYEAFIREQAKNETFVRLFDEHVKLFQDTSNNLKATFEFNCKTFPQPKMDPDSVHELTPMDIKVVAAMGDSITAGTGITAATVLGLLREDRQLSWSIGGADTIYEEKTLPNILKVYNPDVTGYSTGASSVKTESKSHLNVADPGDKSDAMPGQAELLVQRMNKDPTVDMTNDWKMITLFIGGNDLCHFCEDKTKYGAKNYVANLQTALDYLHTNVPKAFVNLVQVLDIAIVQSLNEGLICETFHWFGCPCAAFPRNSQAEKDLQVETDLYRKLTEELILSGRYDTKEDFTVVLQPFFSKTMPPNIEGSDDPDLSYFAPDCFHLSLKGHRAATEALWDNLVEPVGKKRTSWTPNESLECPSQSSPYFYTYKNSGQAYGQIYNSEESFAALSNRVQTDEQPAAGDSDTNGQSVSMTTVAIVTGCVVAMAVVIGVLLRRRKRGNREEREILLRTDSMRIYTA